MAPRVAFVRQRYAQDGGAERFVSRALEALKTRNVQLTLITREWRGGEGFEVITCNPFYLGRLWRDWSFARAVCRDLEKRPFDLVQSHERIACCDIYRAGDGVHREWLKQLTRVRGSLGRLGIMLNPYHCYTKRAEKRMFTSPRLRAVICNSRMVKDEIRRNFGVPDAKLHVIYSGIDTSVYHPDLKTHRAEIRARHGIPESATLFLFVGSGFERKGVSALLQAMTKLPEHAFLLVVGRDKHADRFQRRTRALGLAGRVFFAGAQGDVKPYYGAADALTLPTLYDPFPNVALEAMASGLPVVISLQCGAAELIENGNNGFAGDALDVEGQAGFMRRLLDAETRQRLGRAARRTVEPLTLAAMSDRLAQLYRGLLAPP
ncbi:glycosyl transferase family 1 [Sulfuricaulis limicola]|uniref:Glycosyl transferase family 1 n=1 Tax=Sulfuricaulis limicola TaxID=1620215 RepID=A0A1B4XJH9_9GAMM|nr:glycosyl transferase family 1 [Sulfuricaulis limicola]